MERQVAREAVENLRRREWLTHKVAPSGSEYTRAVRLKVGSCPSGGNLPPIAYRVPAPQSAGPPSVRLISGNRKSHPDEMGSPLLEDLDSFGRSFHQPYLKARPAQHLLHHRRVLRIVLHDQDTAFGLIGGEGRPRVRERAGVYYFFNLRHFSRDLHANSEPLTRRALDGKVRAPHELHELPCNRESEGRFLSAPSACQPV